MIRHRQQPTFVLLKDPLSASEKNVLGRFVADPTNPNHDFAPSKNIGTLADILELDSNSWEVKRSSFRSVLVAAKETSFRARLEHIFKLSLSDNRRDDWKLNSECVLTRRLKLHRQMFQRLMKEDAIKEELLDLLEDNGGKVYMAVAVRSFLDAKIEINGGIDQEVEVVATIPVGEAATATSSGAVPKNALPNPSMEAVRKRQADWATSHVTDGEQIYQIEYRVIRSRKGGFMSFGSGIGVPQFGEIAEVEWGSGTFHESKKAVIYEDDEDDQDEVDGDIDDDIGISEESLTIKDLGASGAILCTSMEGIGEGYI